MLRRAGVKRSKVDAVPSSKTLSKWTIEILQLPLWIKLLPLGLHPSGQDPEEEEVPAKVEEVRVGLAEVDAVAAQGPVDPAAEGGEVAAQDGVHVPVVRHVEEEKLRGILRIRSMTSNKSQ